MSSTATDPTSVPLPAPAVGADDPFLRLHKMSTTAGVGAGDYVAISGLAIAAVLVGVASAVVLFGNPFMLLIPAVGIVLPVVAWVTIGQSNGTQAGRGLAVIGLLLSAGLGGFQGVKAATEHLAGASAEARVAKVVHDFGQDIVADRYAAAYDRCDKTFKNMYSFAQFESVWKAVHRNDRFGELIGIDYNGILTFETDLPTGDSVSGGMVLLHFRDPQNPSHVNDFRSDMFYRLVNGQWMIERSQFFTPPEAPKKGGLMGPPKPKA